MGNKNDDENNNGKGIVEKILTGIGLDPTNDGDEEYVEEEEDYIEDDSNYDDEEEDLEETRYAGSQSKTKKRSLPKFVQPRRNASSSRGGKEDEMYTIHRMHAKTIEDGKQITEYLKNKTTVIINLEGVDLAVAQRIIDYTSGSCFALDAKLESISSCIFMASPSTANVTADGEDGNSSSIDVPNSDFSDYL